jgi:hypothetical protein
LSFVDFGGTVGGRSRDESSLVLDCCLATTLCGAGPVQVGMTRGGRALGERGCFGEPDLRRANTASLQVFVCPFDVGPSRAPSNSVPETFRRGGLCPGALVDPSCSGGRPGIVAVSAQ